MKKYLVYPLVLLVAVFSFHSCSDDSGTDTGTLVINFVPQFSGQNMTLNTEYTLTDGTKIKISKLKFYLSEISLTNSSSTTSFKDVDLFEFESTTHPNITFDVLVGDYSSLSGGFGVETTLNMDTLNPNIYSSSHPLSAIQNMWWGWALQYKFMELEGRYDSDGDGTFESTIIYHTGTDALYKNLNFAKSIEIKKDETTEVTINIEMKDVFEASGNTVDLSTESSSHTQDPGKVAIATKVTDNIVNAMAIQ